MASKKPTWSQLRPVILTYYGNCNDIANYYSVKRRTVQLWISKDATGKIKRAFQEAREKLLDIAETKLTSKIIDGNLTSIIFFLKTQGKARGWIEKIDNQVTGELTLDIKEHIITSKEEIKQ